MNNKIEIPIKALQKDGVQYETTNFWRKVRKGDYYYNNGGVRKWSCLIISGHEYPILREVGPVAKEPELEWVEVIDDLGCPFAPAYDFMWLENGHRAYEVNPDGLEKPASRIFRKPDYNHVSWRTGESYQWQGDVMPCDYCGDTTGLPHCCAGRDSRGQEIPCECEKCKPEPEEMRFEVQGPIPYQPFLSVSIDRRVVRINQLAGRFTGDLKYRFSHFVAGSSRGDLTEKGNKMYWCDSDEVIAGDFAVFKRVEEKENKEVSGGRSTSAGLAG